MTGRRLYDIYCDEHYAHLPNDWQKPTDPQVAWPFLSTAQKRMWSAMAARMKGVKR